MEVRVWQTEELDEQLPTSPAREELNLVLVTRTALGAKNVQMQESPGGSKDFR